MRFRLMLRRAENAVKRVELPSACPCHSRLDARWAAWKTVYSPNAMESVLCPGVELFTGKSVSGHVLAGHALAFEHEVLAEGWRGRLISGLTSPPAGMRAR